MKIAAHISAQNKNESILQDILHTCCEKKLDLSVTYLSSFSPLIMGEKETMVSVPFEKKVHQFAWKHFAFSAFMKKNPQNVFINEFPYFVKDIKASSYLFISTLSFFANRNASLKSLLKKSLKIFVTELLLKEILVKEFAIEESKVVVLFYGLKSSPVLLTQISMQEIKNEYSNGFDYFLFDITNSSTNFLIDVLKSFSKLKKWQKSSIKLLILANNNDGENLIADFKNYKYKEDVCFFNKNLQNISSILAASFALIYFSDYESNSIAFSALQNNIPVIALENESNKVLFEKAAIFANRETLALQMQLLYKDDFMCNELQINGQVLLEKYDSSTSASILYNTIIKDK